MLPKRPVKWHDLSIRSLLLVKYVQLILLSVLVIAAWHCGLYGKDYQVTFEIVKLPGIYSIRIFTYSLQNTRSICQRAL